jgi:hypothetical protein
VGSNTRKALAIPILIIAVGVGWLLTVQGFGPGINWVWTFGLGAIGILAFLVSGFDKVSVVVGPFFLLASLLSILRQTDQLSQDSEVPILVISIGVLLLIAQLPTIPRPGWFEPMPNPETPGGSTPKKLRLGQPPNGPPAASETNREQEPTSGHP